ncbi:hypothetical protein MKX01_033393, partial [Papaver californicum]
MGFLVLVISLLTVVVILMTLLSCNSVALTQDGKALLEIRGCLNDSRSLLNNWIYTDESPCNWTGITCHKNDKLVSCINLLNMQLGGTISPSIGKLRRLQRLALHQNSLHGTIPTEISNCWKLRALCLRANYLQGRIPSEIGNLTNLIILNLSSNSLKGSIPPSIGRLTRLHFLNLSTNFFSGEIPNVGVLVGFGNKSLIGNLDLCGLQLQKPCLGSLGFPAVVPHAEKDETAVPSKLFSHYLNGVLIAAMSAMGLALLVLLSFLWISLLSNKERRAKKYREVNKQVDPDPSARLITFHGNLPYSSNEIIEKLESLDEEHVVGSGGFGTVYRMVMNDCSTFAVKRIDRSREGCDEVFERELEILGSINHINLVKLQDEDAHVTTVVAGTFGYLDP